MEVIHLCDHSFTSLKDFSDISFISQGTRLMMVGIIVFVYQAICVNVQEMY